MYLAHSQFTDFSVRVGELISVILFNRLTNQRSERYTLLATVIYTPLFFRIIFLRVRNLSELGHQQSFP